MFADQWMPRLLGDSVCRLHRWRHPRDVCEGATYRRSIRVIGHEPTYGAAPAVRATNLMAAQSSRRRVLEYRGPLRVTTCETVINGADRMGNTDPRCSESGSYRVASLVAMS